MGFSLGEIFLLILVGIIVVGPKRLPGLMRTAGQWVARLRRMSMDLRSQSGIDDLLRQEGLDQHIHELRSLSRLNVVESLIAPHIAPLDQPAPRLDQPSTPAASPQPRALPRSWKAEEPLREREYPLIGCDAYGALPDDATGYLPPPTVVATDATTGATEARGPQPEAAVPSPRAAEAPAVVESPAPAAEAPATVAEAPAPPGMS